MSEGEEVLIEDEETKFQCHGRQLEEAPTG